MTKEERVYHQYVAAIYAKEGHGEPDEARVYDKAFWMMEEAQRRYPSLVAESDEERRDRSEKLAKQQGDFLHKR